MNTTNKLENSPTKLIYHDSIIIIFETHKLFQTYYKVIITVDNSNRKTKYRVRYFMPHLLRRQLTVILSNTIEPFSPIVNLC